MRGWLTRVVRDLAGMKRRSDQRRAARNSRSDGAQPPAAPDELVAQLQLHRHLAELVLKLDEPYRSTVIARFVEDRSSASIAASLGIPSGTVRKRLHDALSRLRAELDSAGDRTRWAPGVLAFTNGGMHVAKPTKLVLVVLAVLLASAATIAIILVRRGGGDGGGGGGGEETASTRTPYTAASRGTGAVGPTVADARTPARPVSETRTAERAAILAAIASARETRAHRAVVPPSTPATPGAAVAADRASTGTTLDLVDRTGDTSDWQKRALGTLNALLGQCFDLGRAEDPTLAGTVTIRFSLVGEPDVGGLLERVEIVDADTTIAQQTTLDCLTQQLYALELDPPTEGVRVERELHLQLP